MNLKSFVPNGLTLGNLTLGIIGIVFAFEVNMVLATWCMVLAAIFDFFDGLAARALGVSGELGKQLDSLADLTTFGVLPSIMIYQFITIGFGEYFVPIEERPLIHLAIEFSAFILAIFSCLRLAKFNIDTNQSDSFIGVPTPVSALFVASFVLVMGVQYPINMYFPISANQIEGFANSFIYGQLDIFVLQALTNPYTWVGITLFLSVMMVAPIKMLNFKFKEMSWNKNKARYLFLIATAIVIVLSFTPYFIGNKFIPYLDYLVVPIILLFYMVFSIVVNMVQPKA